MVSVSASVNLPLHRKFQKFLFWHWLTRVVPEKGRKTVIVVVALDIQVYGSSLLQLQQFTSKNYAKQSKLVFVEWSAYAWMWLRYRRFKVRNKGFHSIIKPQPQTPLALDSCQKDSTPVHCANNTVQRLQTSVLRPIEIDSEQGLTSH